MEDLPTDRSRPSCHFRDSCPSLLVASSSLRSNTESEVQLDAALFPETGSASGPNNSRGDVKEDELLPGLTDNR